MSNMSDKEYAKAFKKIVSGKVKNNEEIKNFIIEGMLRSKFSQKLHSVPQIVSGASDLVAGHFNSDDRCIFIEQSAFENVRKGQKGALGEMVSTFGHESTHAIQCARRELDSRIVSEEEVENIFNYLNINVEGNRKEMCESIAFCSYYLSAHETLAREGANRYSHEVFGGLKKNPYLKGKWQKAIEIEMETFDEKYNYEKQSEMSFKQVYYKFAGIVAKYPISYFPP